MIETTEIIEVDREKIRQMCLMDDEFFNVCMDGAPDCVELILQIIMDKPDLKVLKVETQRTIANIDYMQEFATLSSSDKTSVLNSMT